MNTGMNNKNSRRGGLTVLEFVGCVVAIVGGVWLGALYLGVDVRHLTHTALAEVGLLERVPDQWRPSGPTPLLGRDELATKLREEFGSLRGDIAALQSGGGGDSGAAAHFDRTSHGDGSDGPAIPGSAETRAYWQRLREIVLTEAALQSDAEAAFNEENAAKVFAVKARASRFAAKSVSALADEDVDPAAIDFGKQLASWFDRRVELYDRAVQIWETPTGAQGRSALTEKWRRAELQHRNEAALLREKAAVVRSGLSRRFGVEFPPFGEAESQPPSKPVPSGDSSHVQTKSK